MTDFILTGLWADRFIIAGAVAGLLSLLAFVPYILDILRGRTKPDRACWLIWSVLASISGASNLYEGASTSLLFLGAQVGGTVTIFALSIRFGSGHLLGRANVAILSVAGLGLVSWVFMDTAVYALAISIGVSALGGLATVWKAYWAPSTETLSAWGILLAAAVLGLLSVGSLDPLLLAYPAYLVALYAAILAAQIAGRMAVIERIYDAAWAERRLQTPALTRAQTERLLPRYAPSAEQSAAA